MPSDTTKSVVVTNKKSLSDIDTKTFDSNGIKVFSVLYNDNYQLLVHTNPSGMTCTVTNGVGQILYDINSASIDCVESKILPSVIPRGISNQIAKSKVKHALDSLPQ